jgi:hypothetical protein
LFQKKLKNEKTERFGHFLTKRSATADGRTRTSTWFPRIDFESTASTIPPHRHSVSSGEDINRTVLRISDRADFQPSFFGRGEVV